MVAGRKSHLNTGQRARPIKKRSQSRFKLIHNSFSSQKVSRSYPVLAGLHSAVDGALFGVLISVGLMSTLALHWQHLWTVSFLRLENTRELASKLMDSTAILERNLLMSKNLTNDLVPTKAEDLLYLDSPFLGKGNKNESRNFVVIYRNINYRPVNHGY